MPATQGARYVSFRGPVGELPQGGDGSYGTSISLYKAVEDVNDVIIAYKQNGRHAHSMSIRMVLGSGSRPRSVPG